MSPKGLPPASPAKKRRRTGHALKTLVASALLLAAGTPGAEAQYIPYPYYRPPQAPATPPSWSYNPYTSGMAPCPQGLPGDLERCREQMPPSYGQPNYWPR
jgi:hypothetical protein